MVVYGLKCTKTGTPVPLKSIDVAATVHGYIAEVLTTMCYKNEEDAPIEAVFVFPVDDQSAVYKFQAFIDGRLIEGECQEKEQANQTYQEAIETGHSAFLLQESHTTGDVFECRVGNLPPNTEAEISFAYVIELAVQPNGVTKFIYPCVLSPRFQAPPQANAAGASNDGAGTVQRTLRKRKAPLIFSHVDNEDLTYTSDVVIEAFPVAFRQQSMTLENSNDYSVKHTYDGVSEKLIVRNPPLDQDLIVYIRTNDEFLPHVLLEKGDPNSDSWFLQKDIAMVNFCPSFDTAAGQGKGEYIFVVDRSGSMGGDRIRYAKEALGEFLDTLPEDCYFNIISFGSGVEALFENRSEKKDANTMTTANNLQKSMDADMGGTQIVPPFQHVYDQPLILGYPRQIFLLTDAAVWHIDDLIALVKKHQATAKVFTFGIGAGASTSLVFGVARAGRGRAEFITDDLSKLPEKVKRTLNCAMSPYVENVQLQWMAEGRIVVTRIPRDIPPIFHGERLISYGLVDRIEPKSQTITAQLTGKINGETALDLPATCYLGKNVVPRGSALAIHRLAAKAQIKELQDQEGPGESKKDQIVLLSSSANIISKYTAFVGVDKGAAEKTTSLAKSQSDRMRTRYVPVAERPAVKKRKQSASPLVYTSQPPPPPPPPPPPVLSTNFAVYSYGGGCSDAIEANRYRNGKILAEAPLHVESAACVSDKMSFQSRVNKSRRGRRKPRHFTHKKLHTPPLPTGLVMFAPWRDGYSYPCILKKEDGQRCTVKFIKDGITLTVIRSTLLSASLLSPGDVVLVSNLGGGFETGLVLEYDTDEDVFCTAKLDGNVRRYRAEDMIVPREKAKQIKDRPTALTSKPLVCTYTTPASGDTVTGPLLEPVPSFFLPEALGINTSDLAELTPDGWINNSLVDFYLRYLTEEKLSLQDQHRGYIFNSYFFKALSDPKYKRKRRARYEAVRPWLKNLDPYNLEMLFVPIFDEVHWYVIAITLPCNKPTSAQEPIRLTFSVMDSYFRGSRGDEIALLKGFLVELFEEQVDHTVRLDCTVKHAEVPVQTNNSDCGPCMLLCIQQCFKENLRPEPSLSWFSPKDTQTLRKEMAKAIMDLWLKQSGRKFHY